MAFGGLLGSLGSYATLATLIAVLLGLLLKLGETVANSSAAAEHACSRLCIRWTAERSAP